MILHLATHQSGSYAQRQSNHDKYSDMELAFKRCETYDECSDLDQKFTSNSNLLKDYRPSFIGQTDVGLYRYACAQDETICAQYTSVSNTYQARVIAERDQSLIAVGIGLVICLIIALALWKAGRNIKLRNFISKLIYGLTLVLLPVSLVLTGLIGGFAWAFMECFKQVCSPLVENSPYYLGIAGLFIAIVTVILMRKFRSRILDLLQAKPKLWLASSVGLVTVALIMTIYSTANIINGSNEMLSILN